MDQFQKSIEAKCDQLLARIALLDPESRMLLEDLAQEIRRGISQIISRNSQYTLFSQTLFAIRNEALIKMPAGEADDFFFFYIIERSLEYLAKTLGFDYVGIWKDEPTE